MSKRQLLMQRRIKLAEASILDACARMASSAETGIVMDIDKDELDRQRETLARLKKEARNL